ncbi:MAG: MBL fold metallo-hydrolase [Gammaproteobacteria bacterium]|jgi:alkyl sulfatase BDS1-like metallo-beta-lactamase superfamily hydrolase|nr:MBL fold metallo-hydrolase [Gammaproteobacteria bacterium]MBT5205022.1 MBL fold metallo-hydrolase [Gammaproteobacteria bacterium]MBT5602179.1 MBL fold metallo-hydrolase [Gammaproteobacteria bacterium]MBT6246142.1 MBL fold metallo-hydrolase [Gammaproteobacteria bacterium]
MSNIESKSKKILAGTEGFKIIADGVYILPGQGNALAVETDNAVILMDSGGGGRMSANMIQLLRKHTDKPVSAICYSHGHLGYNDGASEWISHNQDRHDAVPLIIAHKNCLHRYRRYRETQGLQTILAQMQFPGLPLRFNLVDPDLTFSDRLSLSTQGRRIELLHVPSETDDCIALWLPDDGILYAGAAFPGTTLPNIGTPLRSQRFTVRWAESLDLMAALNPTTLVQEFGPVITDPTEIQNRITKTASLLRWFRDEVVERMNLGLSETEILADMHYPDDLQELDYLKARYGAPEYIVRDLYRQENGWWSRNPTDLHPADSSAAGDAILNAVTGSESIISYARQLEDSGEIQLAMHVIDLIANAGTLTDQVRAARMVKAGLCRKRAKQVRPYVSKALYNSSADLLEKGHISWVAPL